MLIVGVGLGGNGSLGVGVGLYTLVVTPGIPFIRPPLLPSAGDCGGRPAPGGGVPPWGGIAGGTVAEATGVAATGAAVPATAVVGVAAGVWLLAGFSCTTLSEPF